MPDKEWLGKYEQVKNLLISPIDYRDYFTKKEIAGKTIHVMNVGNVVFPTGEVFACDPLVFLDRDMDPYFTKVPTGTFPLDVAVVEVDKAEKHYRYAAVRVKFSNKEVSFFREALKGHENLEDIKSGDFFGFGVDAGLGTVVDLKVRDAFCDFCENWISENPDGNIYDEYFSELFEENAVKNPLYQRDGGDWINFQIPGTEFFVPMIQSGFGDGTYPVYFGYSEENDVVWLIMEFICIEQAFGEE